MENLVSAAARVLVEIVEAHVELLRVSRVCCIDLGFVQRAFYSKIISRCKRVVEIWLLSNFLISRLQGGIYAMRRMLVELCILITDQRLLKTNEGILIKKSDCQVSCT